MLGIVGFVYRSARLDAAKVATAWLQLEQGLRFHDRTVLRKCVERMDQQAVRPDVRLNETQSCWRQSIGRTEAVRDGGSLAVVLQFLVHVEEHFRRELFDLIAHVIRDPVAAFDRLVTAAFQMAMESLVSIRKWLAAAGDNFRKDQVAKLDSYQMAGIADSYLRGVVRLTNLILFSNVEQLGMKRTLKQMEPEFRDGWSDKTNVHWKTCGPRAAFLSIGQDTRHVTIVSSVFTPPKAPPSANGQLLHPQLISG